MTISSEQTPSVPPGATDSSSSPHSSRDPHLKRALTLPSVVAFGLSYMAPSLGMVIFGIIAVESAGTAPTAFFVATVAMLLTALSYAKMAGIYPRSGSAYFYVRRTIGAPVGFLVGWTVLLDYLFLPMVARLTQSIYLNAQFPGLPIWAWLLLNADSTTLINIGGVVLADRLNKVLATGALLIVVVFAAYCVVYLTDHPPVSYVDAVWNSHSTISGLSAAAAVAAYSYLGFDAVTTLSEETINPRKTIPRAVVLVVAIGGALFIGVALLMQLVHPGSVFDDPEIAGYTLSIDVGGQRFADITNFLAIVAGFGSALAVQLSSSRLLYIMGRDGVLPRRIFGALHPRTRTPIYCLVVTGAMSLLGIGMSLQTATSFINFGAFTAFTLVNLSVVVYYVRTRKTTRLNVITFAVLPGIAACFTAYMVTQLSASALTIGGTWLTVGVLYLLWLTRMFRRPTPELGLHDDTIEELEGKTVS